MEIRITADVVGVDQRALKRKEAELRSRLGQPMVGPSTNVYGPAHATLRDHNNAIVAEADVDQTFAALIKHFKLGEEDAADQGEEAADG